MKSRLEWKVGLFVSIGLLLLAILLIEFSKGASMFRSSYRIVLRSENVAGLKNRADVLMSGVKVGSVNQINLSPDGKSVAIDLRIYSQYRIYKDAEFTLEQAGFLGDQYIAITPTENKGEVFKDGDEAKAEAPFNLQAAARSATGLVKRVEDTAKTVNQMLVEMHQQLLTPATMTNLSITVSNMRSVSERALLTVDNIQGLVSSNGPSLSQSSSNLAAFSSEIRQLAQSASSLLATNEQKINSAVGNIEASSQSLKSLMADVEGGKGLAGKLIKNEELSDSVSQITHNLSITSSNLNRLGLWGILWSRKQPRTAVQPSEKLAAPKEAGKTK